MKLYLWCVLAVISLVSLTFGFTTDARIMVVKANVYDDILEGGFGDFSSLRYNSDLSYVMFDVVGNRPIPDDLLQFLEDWNGEEGDVSVLTVAEWQAQKEGLGFVEEEE